MSNKLTDWAQNIALGVQVLVGALTTALGAALSGKNVCGMRYIKTCSIPKLVLTTSMLDICCGLTPWRYIDTGSIVSGAHEGNERATNFETPCPNT